MAEVIFLSIDYIFIQSIIRNEINIKYIVLTERKVQPTALFL